MPSDEQELQEKLGDEASVVVYHDIFKRSPEDTELHGRSIEIPDDSPFWDQFLGMLLKVLEDEPDD